MTIFKKVKKILDSDQKDREELFKKIENRDRIRAKEIKKLLQKAETEKDYLSKRTLYYIGVVLQHSVDINDQKIGAQLTKKSIAMGSKESFKLYKAVIDRILI